MRIFLSTVAIVLSSVSAHALTNYEMRTLGRTSQPIGHLWLCEQLPEECSTRSKTDKPPVLTNSRWADLVAVNNHSNLTIEPLTDNEVYGVEEHWTYPISYGDCEDYVLMKRKMLLDRGWPISSLLITVVKRQNGEGHAVLTVRTNRGDFVLDNLESKISLWHKTPYRFLKRQSKRHTGHWVAIADKRQKVASY